MRKAGHRSWPACKSRKLRAAGAHATCYFAFGDVSLLHGLRIGSAMTGQGATARREAQSQTKGR